MAESRTAVIAALLGNAALAVLKAAAAALTGSSAMLAETFHSIADTGNQVLLVVGMRLARRPPDARHPFGHGMNVYFWAFVVSMMLFSVGGAFAIREAVRKFLDPSAHAGHGFFWSYVILGGAVVFESVSLAVALHALRSVKGRRRLREYWRENRDPTLPTVLLEDSAALGSLVAAAAGLALTHATGDAGWDAAASAVIGAILIVVAGLLALETHSLLIGESAPRDVQATIRRVAGGDEAVKAVVDLQTMHVGPDAVLVVLGLQFRDDLSTAHIEAAVRRVQARVREALDGLTTHRLVAIEPAAPAGRPRALALRDGAGGLNDRDGPAGSGGAGTRTTRRHPTALSSSRRAG